ncbi:MAG: LysR family transcriptional regulator substrate-binding protein, partial [Clostridia bacterium]|nr:LysR family transcriptional regulator substrate-binding protein [Clostridia bacterium]
FSENEGLKDYLLTREDILKNKHLNEDCPKINLKEFKDSPFILLKKGNDTRRRANLILEEEGTTLTNVKIYLDQLITSYNMVCFGLGVGIVNDVLVKSSSQTGCVYYKISGRSAYRTMSIGYKKNRYLSKAMKAFIETAKEVYKNN